MQRICTLLLVLLLTVASFGDERKAEDVGPYLQSISVNIVCPDGGQGSGAIFLSQVDQEPTAWVLTAHHVVKKLREVKSVIGSDGEERKQVRYRDAQMVQEQVESGRGVGEIKYDARVVNVDPQRDIALLRVRKGDFSTIGAELYLDPSIPTPGTLVYHCGAPGGKEIGGTCSLTSGIVSRLGVRIPEFGGSQHGVFDQTDCAGLPGSSGGLIALRADGRWVGMITLGLRSADSFHWVVPVRSVRAWAKEINVEWLFDPKLPRPTKADLEKIPLELNPPGFASADAGKSPAPAETNEYPGDGEYDGSDPRIQPFLPRIR